MLIKCSKYPEVWRSIIIRSAGTYPDNNDREKEKKICNNLKLYFSHTSPHFLLILQASPCDSNHVYTRKSEIQKKPPKKIGEIKLKE